MQLADLTGKVVHSQAYHSKQVNLDLSHLRAGAYLLLVKSENKTYREKLLVQ